MAGYQFHLNGDRALQLFVYEDRVVFCVKSGAAAFFARATPHETTVYFKDCTAVSFKKAGWDYGYITFDTPDTYYTITWESTGMNDNAYCTAEYCKKQIAKYKSQASSGSGVPSSVADELLKYKQLLDMGAITEQEFEKKKKELLG